MPLSENAQTVLRQLAFAGLTMAGGGSYSITQGFDNGRAWRVSTPNPERPNALVVICDDTRVLKEIILELRRWHFEVVRGGAENSILVTPPA